MKALSLTLPRIAPSVFYTLIAMTCLALTFSAFARADDPKPLEEADPAALFRGATEALDAGRPGEAIAKLEALGDHGIVDAVVSFDRGLAYAARVRAGSEEPGDLGRAAHGFEEARELTHNPALAKEATSALATIRSEVARRRSRAGDPIEIEQGYSLGRSIVDLLPENAWAVIAAVMALALSAAIVGRRNVEGARAKVAATTSGALAGLFLVTTAVLAWAARDARLHLREGVIVAPKARLLDVRHLAVDGTPPLPEGARARILDESSGFSHVVIGSATGYLPSSSVLPIAKR